MLKDGANITALGESKWDVENWHSIHRQKVIKENNHEVGKHWVVPVWFCYNTPLTLCLAIFA